MPITCVALPVVDDGAVLLSEGAALGLVHDLTRLLVHHPALLPLLDVAHVLVDDLTLVLTLRHGETLLADGVGGPDQLTRRAPVMLSQAADGSGQEKYLGWN